MELTNEIRRKKRLAKRLRMSDNVRREKTVDLQNQLYTPTQQT